MGIQKSQFLQQNSKIQHQTVLADIWALRAVRIKQA